MRNFGEKTLEKRRSDSTILDLLSTTGGTEPILREAVSDISLQDVPIKITFLKGENDSIGDNLDETDNLSEISSSNDEYPIEFDDFEKNMEQYVIVSKYGLPSKFRCTCRVDGSIPSSRSCTDLLQSTSHALKLSKPKSCFEFTKNSEDIDSICLKHVNNLTAMRQYKDACQIYDMFIKSSMNSEEFDDVEYSFQLQYPNLWDHLIEHYNIYPDSDLLSKEDESKLKIIHSCKYMLKEEEIYRMKNIDLFKNKLKFSGKKKDLQSDFEISCNYLKEQYPFLFTVLTWKHKLSKFVTKRMAVEKNRLIVIQMANLPHEILMQHDEICGTGNQQDPNSEDEYFYDIEDDYDDEEEN